MCGIAGCLDASGTSDASDLERMVWGMTDTLEHRGPDDRGVWVDPDAGVGLGNRRLAILDLSPQGHQPMRSASGRYVLAFNGEIYNFRALRRDLEAAGQPFRGHSDTEVVLAAVTRWGIEGALARFNGMFAMALWDRHAGSLHLVRDRLGEKPLYYGWCGDRFLFGSELKALRAHPAFEADIDRDALALYLRHKYVPTPWSIFRGIRKLPPGTWLTIRGARPGGLPAPVTYWSAREETERAARDPFIGSTGEAVERLEDLLGDAVRLRLESDVPLGAFLSGGVDSSTVVALMQAQADRPIKTFTIGLLERGYDESDHARAVARHLGTDHTEMTVTPVEAMEVIPLLADLYDEPFADSSQVPTFLVARLARRHVTVALSGDGGDELFGGYNRYLWVAALWRAVGWMPGGLRRGAASLLGALSPATVDGAVRRAGAFLPGRLNQRIAGDKVQKLSESLAASDPQALYHALVSHWKEPASIVVGATEPPTTLTDPARWPDLPDVTRRMMYLDAVTYLPDDILAKVDRATMGVGLEARVPFLDHRVAEFAWRLPLELKLRDGRSKWLLRQVLYRHVPPALIERPKSGFGIPVGAWLRGPLRDWAESLLDGGRIRDEGFLEPGPIRRRWEEHLSGRRNWQFHLWDVLMFQSWLEAQRSERATTAGAVGRGA